MIKNINIAQDQLSIQQRLLYLCKKSAPGTDIQPEIDFLILDREMQQLQQLQSKTCQQIVQFVDEHLQKFIQINNKFKQIQQNVQDSQVLIKKIIPKLDTYKTNLFSPQSKIQQFVTNYQKKLMQHQLSQMAKQQTQFLLSFIRQFEIFININVEQLTQKHKFQIVRLLRKKQFIKWVYEHPLIRNAAHNSNQLSILLANINQQLQFYLSQQLSRVVSNQQLKQFVVQNGLSLIQELQIWYQYMGKQEGFFQIIQQSIIGRKLPSLQQLLVSHKQSLVVGNDQIIVKQFFSQLFSLVQQFPIDYPKDRILRIINKFLSKKELNFIYSYVVPTFPISFTAYKQALSKLKNQEVKADLQIRHGWNLRFWADLRIKSIMDRSGKDKQKPLNKWMQIVFKKNFMIYGVKNYMIKLAFLLVNRYCSKFQQQMQFTNKSLNEHFNQLKQVTETVKVKLIESFDQQIKQGKTNEDKINKIVENIQQQIREAIKKWILSNMQMILNSCKGSLEPYKSFVMGVISKKGQRGLNTQQNILKPLRSYFKNNPQIESQCCKFIQKIILSQIERYYDSEYVKEIYNYCHSNISTQQMRIVMEIVSVERQNLFELVIQNNEKSK